MHPFRTIPWLSERVWGGTRLTPPGSPTIGESWLVGPWSRTADGPEPGATLDELAAVHGASLIGQDAPRPGRFPFLVKLLDPAEWLSIQVHPDDEQALRLEGPGGVGKTEAWVVLEASPGAAILLGVRPSVTPDAVREGIRNGDLADLLLRHSVAAGEAYLVPAGTIHSVGPGALLYEIQQPSDLTYRCDDWGRPATATRFLHVEQSLAVARVTPSDERWPAVPEDGPGAVMVGSDYFVVERLQPGPGAVVSRDPAMASIHVLTVVGGRAIVRGDGWVESLAQHESLVIPADAGPYAVAMGSARDAADDANAPGITEPATLLLARLPGPARPHGAGVRPTFEPASDHVDPP
jgi:mannose-6-phosphate isomerase